MSTRAVRNRVITGALVMLAFVRVQRRFRSTPDTASVCSFGNDYSTRVQKDLPGALRDDLGTFDASHVSDRLPRHFAGLLGEPRTTGVLWGRSGSRASRSPWPRSNAVGGCLVLFGAAGLAASVLDLFFSVRGGTW
jgi:hypothetical protein